MFRFQNHHLLSAELLRLTGKSQPEFPGIVDGARGMAR